jgi:hypothetical protein
VSPLLAELEAHAPIEIRPHVSVVVDTLEGFHALLERHGYDVDAAVASTDPVDVATLEETLTVTGYDRSADDPDILVDRYVNEHCGTDLPDRTGSGMHFEPVGEAI